MNVYEFSVLEFMICEKKLFISFFEHLEDIY